MSMKKWLAGILTIGMFMQSLPVSALAAPQEEPGFGGSAVEESQLLSVDVSDGIYQQGAFGVLAQEDERELFTGEAEAVSEDSLKAAELYCYQQLSMRAETIDVSEYGIPREKIGKVFSGTLNDHPDLYFVEGGFSYLPDGDTVRLIYPRYMDGLDDNAFQTGLNEALSAVETDMSDLEKAVALHDYLVINCEYDYENYLAKTIPTNSYSAYGVLVERKAVCQGYALTYKLLLNKVGIECYMVTSSSMNHAWNLIKLDGQFYQVDVTWDDPVWDRVGRVVHNYMFCSDEAFQEHSGWQVTDGSDVVSYTADDAAYDNAFWKTCRSPLVLSGEDCYYTAYENGQGVIKKGVLSDIAGNGTIIKEIGIWRPLENPNAYYASAYSGLFLLNGRLFYNNMESICSIAPDGSDPRIEFTADTTEGYLFGSALCGGKVLYALHPTPGSGDKETVLIADITVEPDGQEPSETEPTEPSETDPSETDPAEPEAPKSYTITYVLGGGENSAANPPSYTSETDTIVLQEPVRQGYVFEGWYADEDFLDKVTDIPKGSKGDLILYAKWSKEQTALPEIDMTPAEGNVLVGFAGAYYTESAETILDRLNEIRMEACQEGVTNPATGKPLTLDDYVPLQWSAELEAIARLRAAEATVKQAHERPNGKSCFTAVTTGNQQSYAENLAWNYTGMMQGIEQWYDEKDAWVNQTAGKQTGHYTSIINPKYKSVAVAAFRLSSGGWYAVAQEFHFNVLDDRKDPSEGVCEQPIEVVGSRVKNILFAQDAPNCFTEGEEYTYPLTMTVEYEDYYNKTVSHRVSYREGGQWSSSDESVAAVDQTGRVSARASGRAVVSIAVGDVTASRDIYVYNGDEVPFFIQKPSRTTYKVGEKIDLAGATVSYLSENRFVTKPMTAAMLSGFDSAKPGISTVSVSCNGFTDTFDTLIVAVPEPEALYGQKLSETALPDNDYGTYTWKDGSLVLDKVGRQVFEAVFTPKDTESFQELELEIPVSVKLVLDREAEVYLNDDAFVYDGTWQKPKVIVSAGDHVLTEQTDYTVSYRDNREAGTAVVTVTGINDYKGSVEKSFEILPAELTIRARDMKLLVGAELPDVSWYEYEVLGLAAGDELKTAPLLECGITGTLEAGKYDIIPSGADAGPNYTITYVNGVLTVAEEYVTGTVTFDVQGHGTAPADMVGVRVGATITRPEDPGEEGYRFAGWYKDPECTQMWDFETDIVQSDITLYAKWLRESATDVFAFQEIGDVVYTGKACKPTVSVYDGQTLLKVNKDYKIKYFNNTNVNKNGVHKSGNGAGEYFNDQLPYVQITGIGNYEDEVKVNFNILPKPIGDGTGQPADKMTLKVSEQLVTAAKAQKPFSSIKYTKAMKKDTDYRLELTALNAADKEGRGVLKGTVLENAAVPAGYSGTFLLTVSGMGNYEGSIVKTIQVTDKAHLIKNVTITLGKNLKNVEFAGKAVELTPSETAGADTFIVRYGSTILRYNTDYKVSYRNNDKVGKAELIVTGMGDYRGSKSVTFNIKGKAFSARTIRVEGLEDRVYTGKEQTQSQAVLTYGAGTADERRLEYGKDYTIRYSKDIINKGTVSVTFVGAEEAGFSGSVKKTFRIKPAPITDTDQSDGMSHITVGYSREGAKPVEQIQLKNREGRILQNGRDYTLRYANYKAVAAAGDEKPPTVIIKGKGNYTGEFKVFYTIIRGGLDAEKISVRTTPVQYQANKADAYAYRPAVKVLDGKSALKAGKDYVITYVNNTQADYRAYMEKLAGGTAGESDMPRAVITAKEGSSYRVEEPIVVPLPIYQNKLTRSTLTVEVGEAVYDGAQLRPQVTVSYQGKVLSEGEDYVLTYGTNVKAGKNQGSVKISGAAPYYGGDVTVKFNIGKRELTY